MNSSDDDETRPIDRPNDGAGKRSDSGSDETVITDRARGEKDAKIRRIGRYRLISELGQGGQGAVYLAEDERIHRQVALKVLFGGLVHSPEARLRFEREAEVTSRLNHPGVARIYEIAEADGVPFIAMELVAGQPLSTRIKEAAQLKGRTEAATAVFLENDATSRGPGSKSGSATRPRSATGQGSLRAAARFIEATARALHVAHEAGLIHRDIKPGNIMVREDASPCILDFGLAHDASSAGITLTGSNDRFGTPAYMAPEQVRGQTREIDRRTDVWALGVTLYECCTLARPFEAETLEELYKKIKHDEPLGPRRLNPKIPKDLEAIILTAIDKDQNRRYATARDLAEDLRRSYSYEPVLARPAGRLLKARRWVQRNKLVTSASSMVMLALLGAALTFRVKSEEADRERAKAENATGLAVEASARAEESLAEERKQRDAKDAALVARSAAIESVEQERDAKQEALDNYRRLADTKRLKAAISAAAPLFPPAPELVVKLEAWQADYGELALNLESHERFLSQLRQRAIPYPDETRRRDFAAELAEIDQARSTLGEIDDALTDSADDASRKILLERRESLAARLQELSLMTTNERRSWRFDEPSLQFQHDLMAKLVQDLGAFASDEHGPLKTIAKRLAQSRAIARETLEGEFAARWISCLDRVKNGPHYSGFDLKPQLGLIPLGPDPDSGLEEFLHWLTHEGPLPTRAATGEFVVTESLGVILVLVPGGSFLMGSQKVDRSQPNFDPGSLPDEQPVNMVTLDSFLLSKYEMTQAQWLRAFGSNPSRYQKGTSTRSSASEPIDGRHPVEQASWVEIQLRLPRIDLTLPTEAEWERGARAGRSDEIFSACSSLADLRRFANIAGKETEPLGWSRQPDHEDAFRLHAPVGSLAPNDYGLFDMSGNLWELCFDSHCAFSLPPGARGIRNDPNTGPRILRGGAYTETAAVARVATRIRFDADNRNNSVGFRPARLIH